MFLRQSYVSGIMYMFIKAEVFIICCQIKTLLFIIGSQPC